MCRKQNVKEIMKANSTTRCNMTINRMLLSVLGRKFDPVYTLSKETINTILDRCETLKNNSAKTVLVIDDLSGQIIKKLQKRGLKVTLAVSRIKSTETNAAEAIKKIKTLQKWIRHFEVEVVCLDELLKGME